MAKVDSNVVALSYIRETAAGEAPTAARVTNPWRQLEPNEISTFGAEITTIVREPISDNLQRRKGTITDFDSSVAFTADLTVDGLWDWLEGAVFAYSANRVVRRMPVTVATGSTTDTYSVAGGILAAGETPVGKLGIGTLLWASEFAAAGNNGLKSIKTAPTGHATQAVAIAVNEDVTAAPAAARTIHGILQLAGYRIPAATSKQFAWSASARQLTLTTGTTALARILTPGQTVHIGSVASVDSKSFQNGVGGASPRFVAEDKAGVGYARVLSISNTAIVFDRVDETLQADEGEDTSNALDIIAGDFVRNVPRSHGDYVQLSHHMELVSPDLHAVGSDGYEYATGQVVQSLAVEFPLTDTATMTVNLVGEDVEPAVDEGGAPTPRKAGAGAYDATANSNGTEVKPDLTEAFNTSADFARLRITGVDDAGVTTDFKSLTLTISAQVTPEKALNTLGARFVNRGILLVDSEAQVIFSNPGVPAAIRNNTPLRLDAIIGNNDGVFVFELPSMTVGGGGREYPANAAVLLNTTGGAFEDEQFETSIHVSYMPVPIPTED